MFGLLVGCLEDVLTTKISLVLNVAIGGGSGGVTVSGMAELLEGLKAQIM